MGVDTFLVKLITFMISAAIGAIGGVIYAFSLLYVLTTHAVFGLFIIVRILSINIVGGFGTRWAPVLAVVIPGANRRVSYRAVRLPGAGNPGCRLRNSSSLLHAVSSRWHLGKDTQRPPQAPSDRRGRPIPGPT